MNPHILPGRQACAQAPRHSSVPMRRIPLARSHFDRAGWHRCDTPDLTRAASTVTRLC
jgi:hypothetical protein